MLLWLWLLIVIYYGCRTMAVRLWLVILWLVLCLDCLLQLLPWTPMGLRCFVFLSISASHCFGLLRIASDHLALFLWAISLFLSRTQPSRLSPRLIRAHYEQRNVCVGSLYFEVWPTALSRAKWEMGDDHFGFQVISCRWLTIPMIISN